MHWLLLALSFLFVLAAATVAYPAAGQETAARLAAGRAKAAKEPKSPPPAEGGPKASEAEIRKIADVHYMQCMNDWDAGTHMTKKEWERACRRIADERAKFRGEGWGN